MCEEFYTKRIIDRKKGIFLVFSYNHLFENMNWFGIPNFGIKVAPFIYAIGEKVFLKDFVLEGMTFVLLVNADLKG